MAPAKHSPRRRNSRKKWTLMFFLAGDNPLAPSVVYQMQALKNAGYHPDVNVIAQFDPHAERMPTHVLDVNLVEKVLHPGQDLVGILPNESYPRNLVHDKLWLEKDQFFDEEDTRRKVRVSIDKHLKSNNRIESVEQLNGNGNGRLYDPPEPDQGMSDENDPAKSLKLFLKFCREQYPAEHYMLFILGHGVIVGNDMFLFDEHAGKSSLKLPQFGDELKNFGRAVREKGSEFELIGFHSCSMSSLEVAYELQGTAHYMLASQGPAFVGSWPYTRILMRIFNDLNDRKEVGKKYVRDCVERIFDYVLYNSLDFQLAGYSFDVSLCDLGKVSQINKPLKELSTALKQALAQESTKGLILLAHWDAQSYWRETYTDLYDFCFCLVNRIEKGQPWPKASEPALKKMLNACCGIIDVLEQRRDVPSRANGSPRASRDDNKLIIRSAFAGPSYQYSHGLSVFFPWSKPTNGSFWEGEYHLQKGKRLDRKHYEFAKTLWDDFLDKYFTETQRLPLEEEMAHRPKPLNKIIKPRRKKPTLGELLLEHITTLTFNEQGQLGDPPSGSEGKGSGSDETGVEKGSATDESGRAAGDDSSFPSLKNHPSFSRQHHLEANKREKKARTGKKKAQLLSPNFWDAFKRPKSDLT
jgi:hypothetical protein